jgi:hypothetical protein
LEDEMAKADIEKGERALGILSRKNTYFSYIFVVRKGIPLRSGT